MAEGDTILRAARRIEAALAGETLAVRAPNPRGRAARLERLDGRRLLAVRSHGKNLLLECDGLVLHSHLGMNGSWHVYRRGERWAKPARGAWAVLEGQANGAQAVQFGGPTLRLLGPEALSRDSQLARLGPDILAPELDLAEAIARLRSQPRRELGDALLDQGLVAGIGNIFKSESCFAARLDPWRPIGELDDEALESVLLAAREPMLAAVAERRLPYAVYKRAGRPCKRCGTAVRSRGQGDGNRTTYWCPSCQAE